MHFDILSLRFYEHEFRTDTYVSPVLQVLMTMALDQLFY